MPPPKQPTHTQPISPPNTTPPPFFHPNLIKRDRSCGDLQDKYPNAIGPTCPGTASHCTFSNRLQGCCNQAGDCNYYTTCLEAFATESCSGPSCLRCSAAAPYCTIYEFDDVGGQAVYNAWACGALDLAGMTIYGIAREGGEVAASTSMSKDSSTGSTSSSRPTSSATTGTAVATASAVAEPSKSTTHTAAIAGGVVGFVVVALVLWFILWKMACCPGERRRTKQEATRYKQLSQ